VASIKVPRMFFWGKLIEVDDEMDTMQEISGIRS